MEMPARRSNYTLLTHCPDKNHLQHPPPAKFSGRTVSGGYDWDLMNFTIDQRMQQNRLSAFPSSIGGSQRQSNGSSYAESSLSGDYFMQSLNSGGGDLDGYVQLPDGGGGGGGFGGGGGVYSSLKSWAQQTEEGYQLQLALALRLSSEAKCADDPNLLDSVRDETKTSRSSLSSTSTAEALSHRFWASGCLSYFDKVPDGFFFIHGVDPYVWTVCSNPQESGRIPSLESLKAIDASIESAIEVILIDRRIDSSLRELQNRIRGISCNSGSRKEVVDQLAKLICNQMGGAVSAGENNLVLLWKECSGDLKDRLGSVALPLGSLRVGLCRHRALLFKVLADTIDLPCRIAKGCKYCKRDDASSCLVRFGADRELLVDLIGQPGFLCEPDSLLNGPSSISIFSPLHFPRFRQVNPAVDFGSLAKEYFTDSHSFDLVFEDPSIDDGNMLGPTEMAEDVSLQHMPQMVHRDVQSYVALPDPRMDIANHQSFERGQLVPNRNSRNFNLDLEELNIPWSNMVLKEKIGSGSFGTVHRADWNDTEVAVKILVEQDFHPEKLNEFLREVAIMRRLRHPNIVLLMGVVTQPPNLSIVTEYLSKGSLFRLLHKPGAKEALSECRRLRMAFDVANGMNYLHRCNPPIVHRDLKSPNLLVDEKYTVKVSDFGLSRLKPHTFLSSKSAAGTLEWMAPEVLCDKPSNEKSDVYSFGVILWELATLQQPWSNLSPVQVIRTVGCECKRLEIPGNVNRQVAALIESCWANDPHERPSFSTIMGYLKPLIHSQSNTR